MPRLKQNGTLTRILIAEDEQTLAIFFQQCIVRYDHDAHVFTFPNGREMLSAYESHGADLLIINHAMPLLSGPQLIRLLRQRGDKVPIIGISGNPYTKDEFLDAGATAFLDASIVTLGLLSLIKMLLHPPFSSVDQSHTQSFLSSHDDHLSQQELQ